MFKKKLFTKNGRWRRRRTDVLVDAVDSLDVSRHRLYTRLLAAHFAVKQVIGLQVEHASRLAVIHSRSSLLLSVVMTSIPSGIQCLIDQLIGSDDGDRFFFVSVARGGSIADREMKMLVLFQIELMGSAVAVRIIRMEDIRRFINNGWEGHILAGGKIATGRLDVISFRRRRNGGIQDAAAGRCQHGADSRTIVIWHGKKQSSLS